LLQNLGNIAYHQSDYGRAAALHQESLALQRELRDQGGIAASLNGLGNIAYQLGDYVHAAALLEEALALQRALGDQHGIASALTNLGQVAWQQGDHGRSAALHKECLRLSRTIGARNLTAEAMEDLAWVAVAQKQPRRAAQLGGAAETLRETLGILLMPDSRAGHDEAVQAMRAALDEEAFAAAWAGGAGAAAGPGHRPRAGSVPGRYGAGSTATSSAARRCLSRRRTTSQHIDHGYRPAEAASAPAWRKSRSGSSGTRRRPLASAASALSWWPACSSTRASSA
jgi:tetratricopeptide (TPR) repeat protein